MRHIRIGRTLRQLSFLGAVAALALLFAFSDVVGAQAGDSVDGDEGISAALAAGIGAISAVSVAALGGGFGVLQDRLKDDRSVRDAKWRAEGSRIDSELRRLAKARSAAHSLVLAATRVSTSWAQPIEGREKDFIEELHGANAAMAELSFQLHNIPDTNGTEIQSAYSDWMSSIELTSLYYQLDDNERLGREVPDSERGTRSCLVDALARLDEQLDARECAAELRRPPS